MPRKPPDGDEPFVTTSIRIPEDLLYQARIQAAVDRTTIQALIAEALRRELQRRTQATEKRNARTPRP